MAGSKTVMCSAWRVLE